VEHYINNKTSLYIHAFTSGDIKGFNYFFELHYRAICYFAASLLKDETAAEEIADDAFIKLWERHTLYTTPQAIKAFLYRTTRNAAIDVMRRKKTHTLLYKEFHYHTETTAPSILQHIIRAETLARVYAAFDILPAKCKEVFTRLYIEGKSYEETAKEMQLSINTVRNHKMRALSLLRREVGDFLVLLSVVCLLHS